MKIILKQEKVLPMKKLQNERYLGFCMKLKAKEGDKLLNTLKYDTMRYILYEQSINKNKFAAVYANKISNTRGRFETLGEVNLI